MKFAQKNSKELILLMGGEGRRRKCIQKRFLVCSEKVGKLKKKVRKANI